MSRKKPEAPVEKRALTVPEFMAAYGVSRATVYRLINTGKLQATSLLGRRLIPVDSAEALISQNVPLGETNKERKRRLDADASDAA